MPFFTNLFLSKKNVRKLLVIFALIFGFSDILRLCFIYSRNFLNEAFRGYILKIGGQNYGSFKNNKK